MYKDTLKGILKKYFGDGVIEVSDIAEGGGYYKVTIKSCVFDGKSALERQRCFYTMVWGEINSIVKAVSLNLVGSKEDVL